MNARWLSLAAIAAIAALGSGFREQAPDLVVDKYDHFATGFPLTGRHEEVACDSCHSEAMFKGTPRTCAGCHNNVRAEGKSFRHIPTFGGCETCHTTRDWLTARFDHSGVTTNCVSCHNNFLAPGKTADHPATDNRCESCHLPTHWDQLRPGAMQ